jgi:hypothetical protein
MELLAQMRGGDGDPSHSRRGLNARIGESSEMSGGGAVIVAVTGRSSVAEREAGLGKLSVSLSRQKGEPP